ncbi:substrate binding domain-containing protein [Spiribacter halobius]|uniref:LysR substrate-binding domain-containing protein n=1 Tax=Sediminicurvatus halobius TaxID=2182432 RepID=A0A2U2MXB4_9GAMM|nr:substrate binding domain-containing protein [Spiribacter halobius]PWG61505.1 hypothetical protein DEM34_16220 [Spiribacter halobius]UEX79937.1 substrate binding domain-containing protein [Spiribacter halobius]
MARPVDSAGFGVFASPEYVARNGAPADPRALAGHECLAYVYPGTDRRYPWQLFERGAEISIPPSGRLALDHGEALVDAAVEGHGILYVQDYMVEQAIHEGRLTPILQAYWPARMSVALIYREPQHLSRRVSALIGFLRAHFQPHTEGNEGPAEA